MATHTPAPGAVAVRAWIGELRDLMTADAGKSGAAVDRERIELIRELERLKGAAAAAQARLTVDFDDSQRQAQREAGVRERDLGAGVAAQVALARRDSPAKGVRHVGLAHVLVEEMPRTFQALREGGTSEWRATLVARETACLTRGDRGRVDVELSERPGGLEALGDRQTETETRRLAYRLDPQAAVRRTSRAESERRVTLRPAPDTMSLLTGLLPVRQGVAVLASLTRAADGLRATGDRRSRAQIMADLLVERVTGQATADAVPMEVHVVMTAGALLGREPTPAQVEGGGVVPAGVARSWVRETDAEVWLRRLYAAPGTGSLVAMDSARRVFTGRLRRFVVLRDQTCRTPWCGAPIRHVDHVRRAADGGATAAANAQGLCEACNHAKEALGWTARTVGDAVRTTTPTDHRYLSAPPSWSPPAPPVRARTDFSFDRFVLTA